MTLPLLHGLWTPITILLFVLAARPRRSPFGDVALAARTGLATRGGRIVLVVIGLGLVLNMLDCAYVEPWLAPRLGYEPTRWVRALEGDLVERVQAHLPGWSHGPLTWFYLSGYVAGLIAPAVVWTVTRDRRAMTALFLAYAANYVLAAPFYLFFPVVEVGWSAHSDALPLLDAIWPGLSGESRIASGLDNCFPSLHVSMTTSVLWLAWHHGPPGLHRLAWVVAVGTAFTVVALGVHWVLDVASGVPFGILCGALGARLARFATAGS